MKKLVFSAIAVVAVLSSACDKTPKAILEASTESIEASWEEQDLSLTVTCNNAWTIAPVNECNWVSVSPEEGESDAELVFSFKENTEKEERNIEFKLTSEGIEKTITVKQKIYEVPGEAINLSENGTANCYIVKPGSTSAFNCKVKGNSAEEIGKVEGVQLVWQDEKGLVKTLKYAPASEQIVVECSEIAGNALVAAVDAEGNILWSWHLWITDYDPAATLYTTEANASGTQWSFMDRNLGTTTMEKGTFRKNAGLIYQWGRKDPFPAAISYTVQNEDYSYQVDGEPTLYDISNNELPKVSSKASYEGSIALGIAHPDVFYKVGSRNTGNVDEYGEPIYEKVPRTADWSDTSDDDAWGGVSMKKSVYDPCPVGYKVPVCDADGNTPYAWMIYKEMVWDSEYKGATQNGQWFPTIGTRVYASGGLDYTESYPYSGMWIGTAGKASSNLEEYPTLYGQYMFIIKGKRTYKVNKDCRAQGLSLRCVAE